MKSFIFISVFALTTILASAQVHWEKTEVDAYMNACIDAAKDVLTVEGATDYCACTLKKIEKKYPNPAKLSKIKEKRKNKMIRKIAEECIKYYNKK